ncbi:MAG: tetratricopeptide repeat protein [Polyangiales bacterium]
MMRTTIALLLAAQLAVAPFASAVGVQPAQATPVQREQAQAKFVKGRDLFAKKKYAEALEQFRGSMEIVASPNARLYAARSLREMGKLVEAYVEFGRTEIEAKELAPQDPRYVKTGESAAAERKEIEPKLGFVTIKIDHASDTTSIEVGGEEVKRAQWGEATPVMAGSTKILVKTPGAPTIERTVTVTAGEKSELHIDATAPNGEPPVVKTEEPKPPTPEAPAQSNGLRTWSYVAGGVGIAGLATFGIFGAMSRSKYNDLKDSCHGPCPPSRQSDIDSGKRSQTIANIGLVVGVIGVATGVTLFVLSGKKEQKTEVVATPSWIGVQGVF